MRTFRQLLFASLAIMLVVSSCTIEKRVYRRGYHIEWLAGKNGPVNKPQASVKKKQAPSQEQTISDPAIANEEQVIEPAIILEPEVLIEQAIAEPVNSSNNIQLVVPAAVASKVTNADIQKVVTNPEVKAAVKKNVNKDAEKKRPGEKSQLVALILCVLVGYLGIHRFYLGYTTIGIIQLLTLGGCGIWALIDLIRIITGDLKPMDGEYDETL